MSEVFDLDTIITEVRAAAKKCGALIIEAALSVETNAVPTAVISGSDFPGLIEHVRPRLIYLLVVPFDVVDELNGALEIEGENLLERPRIKKLASSWRHRDGQTCRVVLGIMCEGVFHGVVEEADWLSEFEKEAESIAEELERAREEHERKLQVEEKKRFAPLIKQLMADPRFSASKVGVAKRTALASALFPDLDRNTIRSIVELAETDHWLATAGQ